MQASVPSVMKNLGSFRSLMTVAAASLFILCKTAGAAILLVSNNNDFGPGSLRQAISDNETMNGGNTITFSKDVRGTIVLGSGELAIHYDVTIVGPGADALLLSGNNGNRLLSSAYANVNISGLTLAFGRTTAYGGGAGIFINYGSLVLNNCIVVSNTVPVGNAGGGLSVNGALYCTNCTFISNISLTSGFAFNGGAAIYANGPLAIIGCTFLSNQTQGYYGGVMCDRFSTGLIQNCTFYGNSSGMYGGAIGIGGIITVASCTITKNFAAVQGGGIANWTTGMVQNTVIAGNSLRMCDGCLWQDCIGDFTSGGYNLIGITNASTGWGARGDQYSYTTNPIDPMLAPPSNNGGPTYTIRPLPGSPVIDRGNSFGVNTDQRGAPRPFVFGSNPNPSGGDGSDIGAFELGSPPLTVVHFRTNIVVSWPSYYGDFLLESSTNLSTTNWLSVPNTPVALGSQFIVTNNVSVGNRLYRLHGK